MSKFTDLRSEYLSTLKSMDTEEHIDLFFYRPLGFCVAKVSKALSITPNALTIISIFLGVGAGIMYYFSDMACTLVGIALLVCANTLDSADGQLARMTRNYSRIGRILDGMAGDLWFITIYICICLREVVTSDFFIAHHWAIWVLAIVAGASHIKQAQMADYYRQIHLRFLSGNVISELEDVDDLRAQYHALSWKKDFTRKFTLKFYLGYSLQQRASSPRMYRLSRMLNSRYPDGDIPEKFRMAFRADSLPLMKYTNFLSFNWRAITLFVSLLVMMPWIYFTVEITVFNAVLAYMRIKHEAMCGKLIRQLNNGVYD